MILRDAPAAITLPRGTHSTRPSRLPITVKKIYFSRYNSLIPLFLIPSAFKIPIYLYSCSRVKITVNRRTTKAMMMSTTLTTPKITAMIMSMI